MKWINVKDELPKDQVECFLWPKSDPGFIVGAYHSRGKVWTLDIRKDDGWYEEKEIKVTHWMPLPDPPTGE